MFKTEIGSVINSIVDDILRSNHILEPQHKALIITVELEMSSKRDGKHITRYLHLLYHWTGHHVLVGSEFTESGIPARMWTWLKNAYHDSTWRDAGTLQALEDARVEMSKDFIGENAWDIRSKARLDIRHPMRWLEIEPYRDDPHSDVIRLTKREKPEAAA